MFAFKVDYASSSLGRLRREFETLETLHKFFALETKIAVPKPLYFSFSECFFVLSYLSGDTAAKTIRHGKGNTGIRQVFRRAGEWLHHLHSFQDSQEIKLWPDWMAASVDEAATKQPRAVPTEYEWMSEKLSVQLKDMKGRLGLKVFSHGDFHASNLILEDGVTYSFDFTEVTHKLAVYDIVDFLKSDVYWTEPAHEIDSSGVSRQCKKMFFRRYRHPVDREVLDLCIRGSLLIDWLNISENRNRKSSFQRDKFDRLKERLEIAFADG